MNWQDIVGHEAVISRLRSMVSTDRLPHAFLFSGLSGLGKRTVAELFAREILAINGKTFPDGANPDLYCVEPDGAGIKIAQIRELQRLAGLSPTVGPFRVCLIDGAERMEAPAGNCLLKLLEEPPAGFVFILITALPDALLSTLRSRCVQIRFLPIPTTELAQALIQKGHDKKEAIAAAGLGGGSMGAALSLLSPGGLELRDRAWGIVKKISADNLEWIWEEAQSLDKAGAPFAASQLRFVRAIFRDMALACSKGLTEQCLNQDLSPEIETLASGWNVHQLCRAADIVEETTKAVTHGANLRLSIEAMFIRCSDVFSGGNGYENGSGSPV